MTSISETEGKAVGAVHVLVEVPGNARRSSTGPPVVALLVLGLLAACQPERSNSGDDPSPFAVTFPDLSEMEPAVAHQLDAKRQELLALESATPRRLDELARAYAELGEVYQAYQLFQLAAVSYQHALELVEGLDSTQALYGNPETARLLYLLAVSQEQLGDRVSAAQLLERSHQLVDSSWWVDLRLAEIRLALNEPTSSAELVEPIVAKLGEQLTASRDPQDLATELNASQRFTLAAAMSLKGRIALALEDWASASSAFEQALVLAPEATTWRFLLARAYRSDGRIEQAQNELSLAGQGEIAVPDPWLASIARRGIGAAALLRQADAASLARDRETAIELYSRATEAAPDSSEAWQSLAAEIARLADDSSVDRVALLEEAIVCLERAAELSPESAAIRSNRSSLSRRLAAEYAYREEVELARQHARAALELDPGQIDGWLLAATLEALAQNWQTAHDLLRQTMERYPEDPVSKIALARLLSTCPVSQLRNGNEALELGRSALESDPTIDAAQVVGLAMAELGLYDEAAAWHERIIAEIPPSADYVSVRRQLEEELAQFRKGLAVRGG